MTLTKSNIDASTWDTQGEMGYWLGVGFGKGEMAGSDIVLCEFLYTNNAATDKFKCTDRKATGNSLPPTDLDNVDDVDTAATYTTNGSGKKIASLSATFERILDTLDTAGDIVLS